MTETIIGRGIELCRGLTDTSEFTPDQLARSDRDQAHLDHICTVLRMPTTIRWTAEQIDNAAMMYFLIAAQLDETHGHTHDRGHCHTICVLGTLGHRIAQIIGDRNL